jgi:hypothetical protein
MRNSVLWWEADCHTRHNYFKSTEWSQFHMFMWFIVKAYWLSDLTLLASNVISQHMQDTSRIGDYFEVLCNPNFRSKVVFVCVVLKIDWLKYCYAFLCTFNFRLSRFTSVLSLDYLYVKMLTMISKSYHFSFGRGKNNHGRNLISLTCMRMYV